MASEPVFQTKKDLTRVSIFWYRQWQIVSLNSSTVHCPGAYFTLCVTPLPMNWNIADSNVHCLQGLQNWYWTHTNVWLGLRCKVWGFRNGVVESAGLQGCDILTEIGILWMCSWFCKFLMSCQNTPLLRGRACLHLPCSVTQQRVGIPWVTSRQPSAQCSNCYRACKAYKTGLAMIVTVSLIFIYLNYPVYVGHSICSV